MLEDIKVKKYSVVLCVFFICGVIGTVITYASRTYAWCPSASGMRINRQPPPSTPTPPPPAPPVPTKPPTASPAPVSSPQPLTGTPTPLPSTPPPAAPSAESPDGTGNSGATSEESASAKFESASRVWENWWQFNQDKFYNFDRAYIFEKLEGSEENDDLRVTREKEYKDLWNFLINNFDDKDIDLRYPAIVALAKSGDKFASTEIEKLWDEKDRDVHDAVIISMGMLKDQSQIEKLTSVLKSKSEHKVSRGFAAFALGFIESKGSIELFKQIISDEKEDWEVQCACVMSMGLMKASDAVEFLGASMNSTDKKMHNNVRAFCALALGRLGGEASEALLKTALEDDNEEVRRSAVIAIGQARYAGCKDALIKVMENDRDPMTRCFAAISLGYLKDETAADALLKALNSNESLELQGFAALGLGILGKAGNVTVTLRNIAGDTRYYEAVRSACAVALGLLKDKDSIGILIKGVEKKQYPMLKKYSILALGLTGEQDKNAIKEIKDALPDAKKRYPDVYRYSIYSLMMLGESKFALKELKDSVKTDNSELKLTILDLLGRFGDLKTVETLTGAYKKEKQKIAKQVCLGAMGCLIDRNFKFPLLRNITSDSDYFMELLIVQHVLYIP